MKNVTAPLLPSSRQPVILIVDDQLNNLEVLVHIIEQSQLPYTYLRAIHAAMALDIIRKRKPDLIITDWDMPEMDGLAFIRALKDSPATAEIPVIMCTGVMTSSEDLRTALAAGATDYLRKPIDAIELQARIQATLRLAVSYQEIKRLNESKDVMFSLIAHDLLESTGQMTQMIELLGLYARHDWDAFERHLHQAQGRAQEGQKLLDNLLNWARYRFESHAYPAELLLLRELAVSLLQRFQPQADAKNIELALRINRETRVQVSPELLQTILVQLLDNALKFTEQGGRVALRARALSDGVWVEVVDTGCGIYPEDIPLLLQGQRARPHLREPGQGAGLGLRICQELLHKMDSTLQIESRLGSGSTFYFRLPLF